VLDGRALRHHWVIEDRLEAAGRKFLTVRAGCVQAEQALGRHDDKRSGS